MAMTPNDSKKGIYSNRTVLMLFLRKYSFWFGAAFFLSLCIGYGATRDYYEILGVDRNAEPKAIRKAHLRLVMAFHPDTSRGEDKTQQFKDVQEAYEILSDPEKRRRYDEAGWRAGETYPKTESPERGAPDLPEGAEFDHRKNKWFYHDFALEQDVYFDPKTGFPLDFIYAPKTQSDASDLFDELLNPRNVGKRKLFVEKAQKLAWTSDQKKDFIARAKEVLRSATTHEEYPSRENYRRMDAVFDLPFIFDYPELVTDFLKSHPAYRGVFENNYLTDSDWMRDKNFEKYWHATREGERVAAYPISIVGAVTHVPGRKTGRRITRTIGHMTYEYDEHEVIETRLHNLEAFQKWTPIVASELTSDNVVNLFNRLTLLHVQEVKQLLPEYQILMGTDAFKKADQRAKPGSFDRKILNTIKARVDEAITKVAQEAPPSLGLPAPKKADIDLTFPKSARCTEKEKELVKRPSKKKPKKT